MSDDALKHSPLDAAHRALGAKMVPFGGWVMPLNYEDGTLAEHRVCRHGAVAFDVSHLGTVRVEGAGAFDALQRALTNDLGKIEPGRAKYTHLLDPDDASVLDDIIVWWVGEDRFDVMPNASNTDRVRDAIGGEDVTGTRAVIAVQEVPREDTKSYGIIAGTPRGERTWSIRELVEKLQAPDRPDFELDLARMRTAEDVAAEMYEAVPGDFQ